MLFEVYFVMDIDTGNKLRSVTLFSIKYPEEYNNLYKESGLFDLLFSEKSAGENFQKKFYIMTTLIGGFEPYHLALDPSQAIRLIDLKDTYLDALHVLSSIIYASWLYPKARIMHIYPERNEE